MLIVRIYKAVQSCQTSLTSVGNVMTRRYCRCICWWCREYLEVRLAVRGHYSVYRGPTARRSSSIRRAEVRALSVAARQMRRQRSNRIPIHSRRPLTIPRLNHDARPTRCAAAVLVCRDRTLLDAQNTSRSLYRSTRMTQRRHWRQSTAVLVVVVPLSCQQGAA